MRVADVTLGWTKSSSDDAVKQTVFVINDGVTTVSDFSPDVEEMQITVEASKSVQFRVVATNGAGLNEQGGVYSFTLNDLNRPQPATGLGHKVTGTRDVP